MNVTISLILPLALSISLFSLSGIPNGWIWAFWIFFFKSFLLDFIFLEFLLKHLKFFGYHNFYFQELCLSLHLFLHHLPYDALKKKHPKT